VTSGNILLSCREDFHELGTDETLAIRERISITRHGQEHAALMVIGITVWTRRRGRMIIHHVVTVIIDGVLLGARRECWISLAFGRDRWRR
jgi:hypothetical protein